MAGNTTSDIWIAGAFAAFTVDLLVYPLDTVKTRMQSPSYTKLFVDPATNSLRKAAMFRGLYQGVGSVILATLPASGAFFSTYEGVKAALSKVERLPQPLVHGSASALAELVSCAILTPAEVIKQNAQMVSSASGAGGATKQTLARFRSNPLALWRGYGALAGRNLPFTALQFPMFENFKARIQAWRARRWEAQGRGKEYKPTLFERGCTTAAAAGSAGAIAAVVTTPVDVVKTRIMLAAADEGKGKGGDGEGKKAMEAMKKGNLVDALGAVKAQTQKSMWAVGKEVVAEKGWRGLFRGGAFRGIWTVLGSGLYLGVYESGRVWLARRDGRDPDADVAE